MFLGSVLLVMHWRDGAVAAVAVVVDMVQAQGWTNFDDDDDVVVVLLLVPVAVIAVAAVLWLISVVLAAAAAGPS